MKTLVVGGAGFVGSATSLLLHDHGHEVHVMSRKAPAPGSRLDELPFVTGNYIEDDFTQGQLEGYDWLVFCAGSDFGNYPTDGSVTHDEFFHKANIEGLPRFFEAAKSSGVSRAVYMGSFYSFVAPQVIAKNPYVRSRHLSDQAILDLSSPGFNVCSCALPWIVGHTANLNVAEHWGALSLLAQGRLEGVEEFAPRGGANFMSSTAVAEAMLGGLERGESGKSYLIGDENLSWKDFFELWFEAAGRPRHLPVRSGSPIVPDYVLELLDCGATDYEPPAEETALLGYRRGTLRQTVKDSFAYFTGSKEVEAV